MKVIHINSYFVGRTLHSKLVRAISNYVDQQIVFVPVSSLKNIDNNLISDSSKVKILYCKCFNFVLRAIWPLKIVSIWRSFTRLNLDQEQSIVHAHSLFVNGVIAYLNKRRNNTGYIVTVRNTDVNFFMRSSFLFRLLGYKIMENSSAIVGLSPALFESQFPKYYSKEKIALIKPKFAFIPSGIDDFWLKNIFYNRRTKLETKLTLVYVGEINKNKNLRLVLDTCNLLVKEGNQVELLVVGDGPLLDKYKNADYTYDINFLGFISDFEILLSIYRRADIFILPSFHETFGLVYLEAISQGLPILYTRGQGFDGVFSEGVVGYSVDPWSYIDAVRKVNLVVENYSQIVHSCLENASAFSWDRNGKALAACYADMIVLGNS